MSADADRQATHDQIRERFLTNPEYRSRLRSDPVDTLESELGTLTEEERTWIADLTAGGGTDDELIDQVKGKVGAW